MTKLEEEGVPITEGPIEAENGTRFIFTEDPDKYEIELMQYPKKQISNDGLQYKFLIFKTVLTSQ